ncbi:MAG: NAD(P)/FAD-dependent oxidoreductase [Bacilli bacterium]|nr:NAD(P)/FAD-dependent oxidoreductase [Bacilli bacterium]
MKNLDSKYDVLVVGAGILGAFVSRELSKYDLKVGLIEAHNDVGNGCSGANSAIIHSGYDPAPGTLKAKFNALANPMWDEIADELDIDFTRKGSLTVALYDEQVPLLKELIERSNKNGIPTKLLTPEEVKELEPNISPKVKAALYAPTAGIIDPFNAVVNVIENAVDNGVELLLNNKVLSIKKENDYFIVGTNKNEFKTNIVINCAGVHSDQIAAMIEPIDWKTTPRRGEYFVLDHFLDGFVNHTIFPMPSEKGKGILITPTTSNNYLLGPSSELIDDYDDVSTDKPTLDKVKAQILDMVPSVPLNKVIRVFSGNRPTTTRHDFIIEYAKTDNHFINVAGIESPGFVCAPAIAEYVVKELVNKVCSLIENKNYNPRIRKHIRLNKMGHEEKVEYIKNNPDFGRIICNCERVSLGEIKDALSRNAAPTTVKGIKKRCRAGFGLCQGGFCQSKVVEILADYYNISPLDVLYDDEGSNILLKKIKEGK